MIKIDICELTDGRIHEFRPGQAELVAEILSRFWSGSRMIVLSAPPGTGKSVIARAVAQDRTVITTSTVHLQDQYHESLGIPTVKGRKWYSCKAMLLPMTAEDAPCAFDPGFQCGVKCEFLQAKAIGISSRVVVVNNALFWSELALSSPLIDRSLLIIDEAHRFRDDIATAAGAEVRLDAMRFLTDGKLPTGNSLNQWAYDVGPIVRRRTHEAYKMERLRLAAAGRRLAFTISLMIPKSSWAMTDCEIDGEQGIRLFPTKPEVLIGLIRRRYRVLAMSASITDRYIQEMWGVDRGEFDYIESDITFPETARPIFFLPVVAVNKDITDSDLDSIARVIARLASNHPQRGVIHTVSKFLTDQIAIRLQREVNGRIIVGYGRARIEAFQRFRNTPGAILVGPSFSEGVDLKGDLARWQVIVKIPFQDRSDPRVALLSDEQYRQAAAAAFVQTYGRGVRDQEDYCVTYVLDANLRLILPHLPGWVTRAITHLKGA